MAYEWGWGAQPDEWEETDWYDENGVYHTIEELGGMRKNAIVVELDSEDIPF